MLGCGITKEDWSYADYEDDVDGGAALQCLGDRCHGHVKGVLQGGGRRGCCGQQLTAVHGVGGLAAGREGGDGSSGVGVRRRCDLHALLIIHDRIYSIRCKRE